MNETKKLEIAQELAKSFGMTGTKKSEDSHYDRSTGTLFVGSRVYHYEEMEAAKAFFTENKERMKEKGDNAEFYYEIGELAIAMMIEESLGTGGRLVIKETEGD